MKRILLLFLLSFPLGHEYARAGILGSTRYASCLAASTLHAAWQQYIAGDPGKDATSSLEILGNSLAETYPAGEMIYARNPWDLQAFNGRLYLSGGNSSNKGPARNAGPVAIMSLDPVSGRIVREGRVDEEQIDLYRAFNNQLYIPGHDPRESWQWGNYYRKDNAGTWLKFRNIPGALHTYDLAWRDQRMFAGLGTKKGAAVAVSTDGGASWQVQHLGHNRVYTFLAADDTLYAVKGMPTKGQIRKARNQDGEDLYGVAELHPPDTFVPRTDLTEAAVFPEGFFLQDRMKKIVRPVSVGKETLFIGAYVHNDHQFLPFGLFLARSFQKGRIEVQQICLPAQYRPWDLLVHEGYVYFLVEQPAGRQQVIVRVLRAPLEDPASLTEYFHFAATTFARSFTILDGDFYFGLGCEIKDPQHWRQEELRPETGTLLRVRASSITGTR